MELTVKLYYLGKYSSMIDTAIFFFDFAKQIPNCPRDGRARETDGLISRGQRNRNYGQALAKGQISVARFAHHMTPQRQYPFRQHSNC